jgi:hypothetical protein
VEFSNIVNKFGNKDCFTNTSTGEKASFTALNKRGNKVNNFNTGF